jgi:hypothetical protein
MGVGPLGISVVPVRFGGGQIPFTSHWEVSLLNLRKLRKFWRYFLCGRSVIGMLALLSAFFSWLACRLRSRAELEFEVMVLRFQLAVLHRQHPGRPRVCSIDRLLWVWLYRVWPRCLYTIVLVKPATVVQWHRRGFRLYWRWRSHPGRRPVDGQTRKLIREMCIANPSWGQRS